MKQKNVQTGLLILSILLLITISAGSRFVQPVSKAYMVDTLKKASLSFAAARTINALVSVAQKIETGGSIKLFGTGGSAAIAPFEWLDPLNDLVERFSLVMLASCVALGLMLFLNQVMPWLSLAVLLPISLLLLALSLALRTSGNRTFRTGYKLLVITAATAALVPLMAAMDSMTYSFFLKNTYETASITMDDVQRSLATIQKEEGLMNTIERLQQQAGDLKTKAEQIISHIVDLITIFLIQTIVLPLVVVWLYIKLISYIVSRKATLPAELFLS